MDEQSCRMFVDLASMRDLDLEPSETTLAECAEATACATCTMPISEQRQPEARRIAWLKSHGRRRLPSVELVRDEPTEVAGRSGSDVEMIETVTDAGAALLRDARLEPRLAVPLDVLEAALRDLDERDRVLLAHECLAPICDVCHHEDVREARLLDAYVAFRFDGNESAARAQPLWNELASLAAFIDGVAARLREAM